MDYSKLLKTIFIISALFPLSNSFGQDLSDKSCRQYKCKQFLDIKEDGFYIFSNLISDYSSVLENTGQGSWNLSLESDSEKIKRSPIHFGARVSSSESNSGYVSYFNSEELPFSIKATDYTGQLSEIKIKIYKRVSSYNSGNHIRFGDLADTLIHEEISPIDTTVTLPSFPKGHFLITFTSTDDQVGKLGVTINGLPSLSHISFGGVIGKLENAGTVSKYDSFQALELKAGKYVINSTAGNGQPELSVKLAKSGGIRELVYNNNGIKNIYPGTLLNSILYEVEYGDDLNTIYYNYTNLTNSLDYIVAYNNETETRNVIATENPVEVGDGEFYSQNYGGLITNDDSTKLVYNQYQSGGYIGIGTDFLRAITYLYDFNTSNTIEVRTASLCIGGLTCNDFGSSSPLGLDSIGRYIGFVTGFTTRTLTILDSHGLDEDYVITLALDSFRNISMNNNVSEILFNTSNNNLVDIDQNAGADVLIGNINDVSYELISVLQNDLPIEGNNFAPKYGINEDHILFLSNNGPVISLFLYDAAVGYAKRIIAVGPNSEYAIDENAEQIVFTSQLDFDHPRADNKTRLWLYDLTTNKLTLKATSKQKLKRPHISADGNTIAVVAESDEALQLSDKIYLIKNQRNLSLIDLQ